MTLNWLLFPLDMLLLISDLISGLIESFQRRHNERVVPIS